jgi:hypothetical protein
MNPPGRTELLKAQRDAHMGARAAKRRQLAQRLRDARVSVDELASRMPGGFQNWEVARRSAYIALLKTVQRKAHNTSMTAPRLEHILELLRDALEIASDAGTAYKPGIVAYHRFGSAAQLASTQSTGRLGTKHPDPCIAGDLLPVPRPPRESTSVPHGS